MGCCWDSKEGRRQSERQSLIFVLCRGDGGKPRHSGIRAEEAQLSLSGAEEEVTHRPAVTGEIHTEVLLLLTGLIEGWIVVSP